ncbi:hypothetical protein [Listeria booriae]|uniref:Uncharacterized protein n=1 Tax=Listeria booriae TaxID=1552123 RepID=A0A842F348_9LIST|nr:hypothetical protein [Listeria booriae]MBC2241823.1 hypothetical protein [Listeria booriae]MBC2369948.1 hypothetical protein [Listeria booriae]
METSDIIQIIATSITGGIAVITGITAIISVIIAVKSLKLTQKSIEDANKPVVVCYLDMVDVGFYHRYFVIKNFGKTPAKIINISFENLQNKIGRNNLGSLKGTLIAPNQKFVISIDNDYDNKENLTVTIIYEDSNKNQFDEVFILNPNFSKDISFTRSSLSSLSKEANELRNMYHSNAKNNL